MYDNVWRFIEALRKDRDIVEIDVPVDRHLEISAIADRCMKSPSGGPALLFRRVVGSRFPVLINAFGSERRMCRALGVRRLDDLGDKIRNLLALAAPGSFASKLTGLRSLADLRGLIPRTVSQAPCQDIGVQAQDVDLGELPVLRCWPKDGGPFITLPLVFTKRREGGAQNVGVYRMQVYDARTTGMHWQRHKHGRDHQRSLGASARMPVAVAIGADPVVTYAATAPLPAGMDEMMLAGFLRGRSVPMVRCKTVDLKVPAEAEFILEGYVDNAELRPEGPFGDHTGVYTPTEDYPVFHVTHMTRRRSPVYVTTIVGKPPMEDRWLGKATERLFLPLLQQTVPEVVDYNLPVEGGFHNLAIVAIRKRYPGQAKKVMYALWGLGHMLMLTRNIIVVDEGVDVQNVSEVAWITLNNVDAGRDFVFAPGPVDALDHAAPLHSLGTKLGIDATRKGIDEGYERPWPEEIAMSADIEALVRRRWSEYGLARTLHRG
ncbi:MAG: menaquinone biosynthesis decarboxylase [Candidatus Eremiobacteraeota bacterium]|nr:menaquinone biosynthesis decarboxylase [Candidatus Eremiobacteraeota bacterium]